MTDICMASFSQGVCGGAGPSPLTPECLSLLTVRMASSSHAAVLVSGSCVHIGHLTSVSRIVEKRNFVQDDSKKNVIVSNLF